MTLNLIYLAVEHFPTHPNNPKTPNYKHQMTNKFQISNKIKRHPVVILNFGHCDLFVNPVLLFKILRLPKSEHQHLEQLTTCFSEPPINV
jgi:hypothetical protein